MPCAVDALDQREHLLDQQRRQAERRLVEDQQLRLGHQAAADREHLLLAARQRAGALAPAARRGAGRCRTRARGSARAVRGRGGSSRGRGFRRTVMLGKMRRPSGTWIRPRATIADGCARSIGCCSKRIAPRHGRSTPRDRAVERGFAGAVRAEHRDDLARRSPRGRCRAGSRSRRSRRAGLEWRAAVSHCAAPSMRPRRAVAEIGLDHARIGGDLAAASPRR